MTPEERMLELFERYVDDAPNGATTASVLMRVLSDMLKDNGDKVPENYLRMIVNIPIMSFIKETIEREKDLAHIQLERDLNLLKSEYSKTVEAIEKYNNKLKYAERRISEYEELKIEISQIEAKREELENMLSIKSTDPKLYGAMAAYEFIFSKCHDPKIAAKAFDSYLLSGAESKLEIEEFKVCEIETENSEDDFLIKRSGKNGKGYRF